MPHHRLERPSLQYQLQGRSSTQFWPNHWGKLTLILTGSNTYSGGTTVSVGSLLINNSTGSGAATGNVTGNGGALGGTEALTGAVTVSSVLGDASSEAFSLFPTQLMTCIPHGKRIQSEEV